MPTVTRDRFDALVFDLDGTLLDGKGTLAAATKAAVARARDAGYLVVLATGRSLAGTRGIHEQLALDTDACCYNGAWIGRPDADETPWHYAPIADPLLSHVASVEGRARFHFRHHKHKKYTPRIEHADHRRVADWFLNVIEAAEGGPALPAADLIRVSLFFDGQAASDGAWESLPPDAREALHREVFPMAIFPDFEDVGLVLCEVQGRGRGKAEVFRLLEERHGVPASRVVAFGDQQNDVPLLGGAGLAVAMGNAIPAARDVADLVIGDHREDGVARWLDAEVAE
jgi:hydroxymethylpyrimidine pyrophosphatase-like HAD family hydrolase